MTPLRLQGITRHYGRQAILKDINMEMATGERVALLGPNGSGKTTLLRIAAGTLRPTAGTIHRDAMSMRYLPQDAPTYRELSVVDHLRFASKIHGIPWDTQAAIAALHDAGLARMADRSAGTLSRGQRQRLGIAITMMGDPDLILLDEPWTALDADGSAWLSDALAASKATVLAAVHDTTPFPSDRTITLEGGRIA